MVASAFSCNGNNTWNVIRYIMYPYQVALNAIEWNSEQIVNPPFLICSLFATLPNCSVSVKVKPSQLRDKNMESMDKVSLMHFMSSSKSWSFLKISRSDSKISNGHLFLSPYNPETLKGNIDCFYRKRYSRIHKA